VRDSEQKQDIFSELTPRAAARSLKGILNSVPGYPGQNTAAQDF